MLLLCFSQSVWAQADGEDMVQEPAQKSTKTASSVYFFMGRPHAFNLYKHIVYIDLGIL